jgi:hypothetical protein
MNDMMKIVDLSKLFPKQVVLLSTEELREKKIIYKIAQSYLKATEADKKLIWVATMQPVDKLPLIAADYGYPINEYIRRILFVDFISKGAGVSPKMKTEMNISYIENPNNMVEISMTLSDLFDDPTVGLAIIDSVNGILSFNRQDRVLQFLHFLSPIARETDTTILLALERSEHPKELERAIELRADAIMNIKGKILNLKTRKGSAAIDISLKDYE